MDYRDDELDVNDELDETTPTIEENADDRLVELTIDTSNTVSKVEASKKVIALLLGKKKLILIAAIILAFVLLLILLFVVSDSSGGNDYIYKEASCNTVKITYDPYGDAEGYTTTMPLEEYVDVATYAFVKDFPDDNASLQQVYYATAVFLRTEAISHNCEVKFRDKDLKKEKENIVEDNNIEMALSKARGIVIVDDNEKFVDVHVADFCWVKENENLYYFPKVPTIFNATNEFVSSKVKNNILSGCECNKSSGVIEVDESELEDKDPCYVYWSVEETSYNEQGEEETEVTWYKEYLHQDYDDAFQVFGAYFLHEDSSINKHTIINYFTKTKVYYRTIEKVVTDVSKTLKNNGTRSSACNTSSDDANFATFLFGWEGNEGFCDAEKTIYLAKKLEDNADYTIGVGVTEFVVNSKVSKELIDSNGWSSYFRVNSKGEYDLVPGDCVPVTIIDALRDNQMEKEYAAAVYKANEKYNANLTQYQIDALTDLSYNRGSNYVDGAVKSYVDGGYEALWNNIKDNLGGRSATDSDVRHAMQCRRKGEFALFVTGDYNDQGKFYDHRDLSNYDFYDSENVLNKKATCALNGEYMFPLPESSTVTCTDVYGYRVSPTAGATSNHQGLDLATSAGTPIYAARSGEVVIARDGIPGHDASNSAGNWVKLKHDDGSYTAYMHMLNGSVKVKQGDYVNQGDQLGEVGSTGASTGNHLHFSVYEANGNSKDPYNYLDLSSVTNQNSCKGNG